MTYPISGINNISQPLPLQQTDTSSLSVAKRDFSEIFKTTVDQVVDSQNKGDLAISQLNSGEAQNLHDVMIAVEQADLSLRMLVQLRNKALEAYNEILRMNI